MTDKLTKNEEEIVQNFLEKFGEQKSESSFKYYIISTLLSLIGLFVIVYTGLLTLNRMADRVIYWVFLPGVIIGLVIILIGFYVWQYYRINCEKQKLAAIIKKLM